jgi:hypothetical protein
VSGPLSAIFTAENMIKYLTSKLQRDSLSLFESWHLNAVFNFLWRGKRIEFTLAALWNEQLTSMRLVSDIPGTFLQSLTNVGGDPALTTSVL